MMSSSIRPRQRAKTLPATAYFPIRAMPRNGGSGGWRRPGVIVEAGREGVAGRPHRPPSRPGEPKTSSVTIRGVDASRAGASSLSGLSSPERVPMRALAARRISPLPRRAVFESNCGAAPRRGKAEQQAEQQRQDRDRPLLPLRLLMLDHVPRSLPGSTLTADLGSCQGRNNGAPDFPRRSEARHAIIA